MADRKYLYTERAHYMIPAFQRLSEKIGPERVIWRYDPILINDKYTVEYHMKAFSKIAEALKGYTKKCVFSFVDEYAKISKGLQKLGVRFFSASSEKDKEEMNGIAKDLRNTAAANDMSVATCAETIDLEELGIEHNACIDKDLIERLTGGKIKNTKKNGKDSGQRTACRCMVSKEIGAHNTCGNGCVYCYANYSSNSVKKNMEKYDPNSPILCDRIEDGEPVKDAADMRPLVVKDGQMSLSDFI